MVSKPIENRAVTSKLVVDTRTVSKPTTKQTLKKAESSAVKTVDVTGVNQAKKTTNNSMRSVASKKASLPVTGESSNSLKEIGLVMSSAVLGLLGLFGFADKKKH
ncbi:hypothetical protein FC64_GL001297 [Ligilactobacillus araffinosus DSM 20653]|uniref:Gram-positive cocci surface proteins LPxTG domain-containing protein n=1 Tax=Ligilactobacillus araffinosus DSM 20653 TaxID=1423820 RepID=A0A0R1ZAP8_9LACO|nr:hypothetical protein FC64_GL001297 [Ligilactobacillus araffinosus DSM 20653]